MKKSLLTLALAFAAFTFSLAARAQGQTVTFLDTFNGTNGGYPNGLVQGADGNLYGSMDEGGTFGLGGIFRMTPSGRLTTIYSFNGLDANEPFSIMLAGDGNLYGISIYGGNNLAGTFFRVTTGGKFTLLHQFCSESNCTDGQNANGLFLGFDGNFYGTTAYGGQSNHGVFFRVTPAGEFKVLHSFCQLSDCQDGNFPLSPIQGKDGNFYGTTVEGGTQGAGVIYKLTPDGTYEAIHNFCNTGSCLVGGLIQPLVQDAKGNLFGMTSFGGSYGWGGVYELTAENQFKVVHSFNPNVDGGDSNAGLVLASDGNFYGTNLYGKYGDGTLFEITPEGKSTLLYSFQLANNAPYVPLFQGTDGLFYGSTDPSSIFQLSNGLGPLVETVPTGGKVGQRILILGNHLTGTTSVTFNGVPAEFKIQKDSFITAWVPAGASTGAVSVVTPSGTLNSNPQFVVTK